MSLRLLSLWHEVELLGHEKERVHPSGLLLPGSYWPRQDATALVTASGPGLTLDIGDVLPPMVEPGDLVLLDFGSFHPLQEDGPGVRQGFVWEGQLVGWLACSGRGSDEDRIEPLNEYVIIHIDERPKEIGSLALSDRAKRPRSGIVEAVGPGRLFMRGKHQGRRLPMPDIVGRRVYWGREAEVVCAGRYKLQWVAIRAAELICYEMTRDDCLAELTSEAQEMGFYGSST